MVDDDAPGGDRRDDGRDDGRNDDRDDGRDDGRNDDRDDGRDDGRGDASTSVDVRRARLEDADAVAAFTSDTWPELDGDYLPRVFESWVESDGPTQRTLVATVDGDGDRAAGEPVGVCQGVLLTDDEAWAQGMRVAPAHRGSGTGAALTEAVFEWASRQGATVCRNMVFSWNAAGLGQSRALGFEPRCAFRWIEPEPDADAGADRNTAFEVVDDPAIAWRVYHDSDAARELAGLGLDLEESWALAELTRERLAAADRVLAVADADRARGMTYRTRTFDRESDDAAAEDGDPAGDAADDAEHWAEYGVGAWDDPETLRALAAAVARDAADQGADRCRVLVPETPRHLSDAASVRISYADDPDFVFARDLTRY